MERVSQTVVVSRPAFQAVGLKWEGTFAEAAEGGIRSIQQQIKNRLSEIPHVVAPGTLLGLSYYAHPDATGFTHFAAVEVENVERIPDGMCNISVEALTYARCEHRKGGKVDESYRNIYAWIEQQGFSLDQGELTHVEEYPMDQDPFTKDPEFMIMIPIAK